MNRSGIVFSGGVSLGTYESGAGAAFIQSVYETGYPHIKAISGASAGAITAFIMGYTLHKGISPYAMCAIWAEYADIRTLTKNAECILSFETIRNGFTRFLSINEQCPYAFNSEACTGHRGLEHCKEKLCGSVRTRDIVSIIEMTAMDGYAAQNNGMTFKMHNDNFRIDFSKFEKYDINRIIDIVISSAAIPFVFPPISIRKKHDEFKYRLSDKYNNDSFRSNYADGGLTDNLPFMSVFNEGDISALYLVMPHPFNAMKLVDHVNKKGGYKPIDNQLYGLWQTYNASVYQSLYHDMDNFSNINRTINGLQQLRDQGRITEDVFRELQQITDTENKLYSDMEIITPEAPESMLSGEILNHFGGFLRRDIREWDFTTGYLDAYKIVSQKFSLDAPLFEKQAEDLGSLTSAQFRHNRFIVKMIFRAIWNMIREIVKMIYSMLKGGNG